MMNGLIPPLVAVLTAAVLTFSTAAAADEKVPLDKLPEVVRKAATTKFPKAKLDSAVKATSGDTTTYEVTMKDGKFGIDITITSEGKITQIEREMAFTDLPKAVSEAFTGKYPKATVKRIEELSTDDKIQSYELLIETPE